MDQIELRRCKSCQKDKSVDDFYVKDKKTGRRFSECKDCYNERTKKAYHDGGDAKRQAAKEYAANKYKADPEAGRKRTKAWRDAHPEDAKAIGRRSDSKRRATGKRKKYLEKNRDKIRERNSEYREAHKEEIDAYNASYRRDNRQKLKERQKEWREANPEAYREIHSRWKRANREKVNAATHRRRARLKGCSEHHTAEEWEALKAATHNTCLWCGRQEPEISLTKDHVVPVDHGGSNAITNLQPLCKSCNSKKHTGTTDFRKS